MEYFLQCMLEKIQKEELRISPALISCNVNPNIYNQAKRPYQYRIISIYDMNIRSKYFSRSHPENEITEPTNHSVLAEE